MNYFQMKNKNIAEIHNIIKYLQYLTIKKENIKSIIRERNRLKKIDFVHF